MLQIRYACRHQESASGDPACSFTSAQDTIERKET